MRGIIADGSATGYSWSNVNFIDWLMSSESCICVLETWFLFAVESLNEREHKAYTKSVLLAMDPHLDNCPIILSSVTFELFSHYLATKKKKGGGHLSVQTCDGCRSALMHMY